MAETGDLDIVQKQAQSHGLSIRDVVVFLVDWRRSMLSHSSPISDGCKEKAPMLHVVLKSISDIMKSKIIAGSTDFFSIIAFGAGGKSERESWPRMRVIQPLQPLSAAGILKLDGIASSVQNMARDEHTLDEKMKAMETLAKTACFGEDTPVEFDKALWAAKHEFASKTKLERPGLVHRRKVVVLTNDDDPSGGSSGARRLAVTQAKDLFELNAAIDVTLLSEEPAADSEDPNSERSSFFYDVIAGGDEEQTYALRSKVTENVTSLGDLTEKIKNRQRTKRALIRTTLELGPDYKFGVALYSLAQKTRRPNKVELAAETNQPVKKIRTATCESVGKNLRPTDIRYSYKLSCLRQVRPKKITNDPKTIAAAAAAAVANTGGPPLFGFTEKEVKEISNFDVSGLVLYGFKPRKSFRKDYILRAPSFVYPDEQSYTGSRAAFTQLLNSMLKKDLIAILLVSLRRGSAPPRFGALVPQTEVYTSGVQTLPPGFHLFSLPYKNDIRVSWRDEMAVNDPDPAEKEEDMLIKESAKAAEIPPEGTEEARQMISKLTIQRYDPRDFANPDIQKFYAGLEAAAGVDAGRKEQEFRINPRLDQMEDRAGTFMGKFKCVTMGREFDGTLMAEAHGTKTGKRALELSSRTASKKVRAKEEAENAKEMIDLDLFRQRFQECQLNKFTKTDLMLYMRAHGLVPDGRCNKLECVHIVERHLRRSIAEA